MKIVIQRVLSASVVINKKEFSKISQGYLLLVGLENGDNEEVVEKMATKVINIRINSDNNDKTNLSIVDIGGEILSVSQFTLCAKIDGRRPSFSNALNPIDAKRLYFFFNQCLREHNIEVKEGEFQEHMEVNLCNDGPFTIILDSKISN